MIIHRIAGLALAMVAIHEDSWWAMAGAFYVILDAILCKLEGD